MSCASRTLRSSISIERSCQTWRPSLAGRGHQLANAIRHISDHPEFNPNIRQLLHVSFKVAAKEGKRYTDLLTTHQDVVSAEVTKNIYERHLRPLFVG